MSKRTIDVLIPDGYKLGAKEREAAWILANHYKTIVHILRPSKGYMEKTADFLIDNERYELKTPTSPQVRTIEKHIRLATKQSENVIIDSRKTKITEKRMTEICIDRLAHIKKLRKIVLIVDKKKVLDFSK